MDPVILALVGIWLLLLTARQGKNYSGGIVFVSTVMITLALVFEVLEELL